MRQVQLVLDLARCGLGFSMQGDAGQTMGDGGPPARLIFSCSPTTASGVRVSDVKDQGAAQQAGVQVGDLIVAVNGLSVQGASHDDVADAIRAAIPSRVSGPTQEFLSHAINA
jgi:C-terminal processing protease CtpA/Prc